MILHGFTNHSNSYKSVSFINIDLKFDVVEAESHSKDIGFVQIQGLQLLKDQLGLFGPGPLSTRKNGIK